MVKARSPFRGISSGKNDTSVTDGTAPPQADTPAAGFNARGPARISLQVSMGLPRRIPVQKLAHFFVSGHEFRGIPAGNLLRRRSTSPPARQGLPWKTELGGMPLATCKLGYARLSTMALGKDRHDSDAAASIVSATSPRADRDKNYGRCNMAGKTAPSAKSARCSTTRLPVGQERRPHRHLRQRIRADLARCRWRTARASVPDLTRGAPEASSVHDQSDVTLIAPNPHQRVTAGSWYAGAPGDTE